jgi:type IV pilus assembly protein PilM
MFEIGLDLSSYKISAVELFKKRGDIYIKNAGTIDIEPHAIVGGELIDSVVFTNGLKDLWKNFKFQKKEVNLGLSGIKLIVKEIKLPVTDDKDIEKSINYQIEEYIPIAKENILFDFYVIEKNSKSSKVMVIGAMKNAVNNFVEATKDAGLKVNSVDLNCFAFYRAVNFLYNFKKITLKENQNSFCLVHFGQEVSIIEFADTNELRYPRFINSSLNSFIENLNKKLDLSNEELKRKIMEFDFETLLIKEIKKRKTEQKFSREENINFSIENNNLSDSNNINKNNFNLSEEKTTKNNAAEINMGLNNLNQEDKNSIKKPDDPEEDVLINIKDSLKISANQLVNEIIRSNDHFLQENRDLKINKILISGENLINLDKYIEKNLKIPVERINMDKIINPDLFKKNNLFKFENINNYSDKLIISLGLALRGIK